MLQVSQDARDSNKFTVSTFVGAGQTVVFKLVYEELLERKGGNYQLVVKPAFDTIVDDYKIEVTIKESRPLKQLSARLETDNIDPKQKAEREKVEREACSGLSSRDSWKKKCSLASVPVGNKKVDKTGDTLKMSISLNTVSQKELKDKKVKKFVVEYDVDRSKEENEIQVVDGHFVHFFVPDNLTTMPKHVIFILDVSGSMLGEKLDQLKDAMFTILNSMTGRDFFNIISFNDRPAHFLTSYIHRLTSPYSFEQPTIVKATKKNRDKAIKHVMNLSAGGGTNIDAALKAGLEVRIQNY